jgi:hypothetical protein
MGQTEVNKIGVGGELFPQSGDKIHHPFFANTHRQGFSAEEVVMYFTTRDFGRYS